jgi:hypothetical protein
LHSELCDATPDDTDDRKLQAHFERFGLAPVHPACVEGKNRSEKPCIADMPGVVMRIMKFEYSLTAFSLVEQNNQNEL